MSEQFEYTVSSSKGFDEVVSSVEELASKKGFRVLAVHDVQATLAAKELEIEPMKIIEICSAKYAYRVVTSEPKVSSMLPCRISVYRSGSATILTMMLPTAIAAFFPKADISDVTAEVEDLMKEIVDQSA